MSGDIIAEVISDDFAQNIPAFTFLERLLNKMNVFQFYFTSFGILTQFVSVA